MLNGTDVSDITTFTTDEFAHLTLVAGEADSQQSLTVVAQSIRVPSGCPVGRSLSGRPDSAARDWASLTATELRIAEQVGQSRTSPQIAAELYLSPRTVQTHISNILRKLDLHSRVEIAAVVARQG